MSEPNQNNNPSRPTPSILPAMLAIILFLVSGWTSAAPAWGQKGQENSEQTKSSPQNKKAESQTQPQSESQTQSAESQQHGGHRFPVDADGNPKFTNALAGETSPYLLQHVHNPVQWYPWTEATLKKAKDENKIIFLSIGYSSCHWCHVMERESFLDEEIAEFMNENFICIKVDREERPDVDKIYMESLQVLNQITRSRRGGGWPLSMFLTPKAKPFFGGTYFPARDGDRGVRTGFFTLLKKIDESWVGQSDRVEQDATMITDLTKRSLAGVAPPKDIAIQTRWVTQCQEKLSESFDPKFGGFRFDPSNARVPKFPEPSNLLFLIHQVRNNPDDDAAKNMLITTCERMMWGGIYDHLGGGFHRYSVDRYWAIPHFEKMLYDNAQLAVVYSELYEMTKREDFREVVEGILGFVTREMTDANGGFYSALDAESEGEEGKFNRWELAELKEVLSAKEYELFAQVYRLNEPPNFEGEYYAPQLKHSLTDHAKAMGISRADLESKLTPIRKKLFDVREKRVRPLTDTKILSSWNGMMIRGYADAGRILNNDTYIQLAKKSAEFSIKQLFKPDGRLYRTHTNGQSKLNAYLNDYTGMIDGLLALHRATGEDRWLEQSKKAQTMQDELFWDDVQGGYFFTSSDHEVLIARSKNPVDGAVPSGNSVAAGNLLYLAKVAEKAGQTEPAKQYQQRARRTVIGQAGLIDRAPIAAPRLMISAEELLPKK